MAYELWHVSYGILKFFTGGVSINEEAGRLEDQSAEERQYGPVGVVDRLDVPASHIRYGILVMAS